MFIKALEKPSDNRHPIFQLYFYKRVATGIGNGLACSGSLDLRKYVFVRNGNTTVEHERATVGT